MASRKALLDIYHRMLKHYGPQHWWPAETQFEIMVGTVLTQAVSWPNVEKAISNLKALNVMSPQSIRKLAHDDLARLIYSTGYHNAKARKLKALAQYIGHRYDDNIGVMAQVKTPLLRTELLSVHGIGEETADDILLYAIGKPKFVVDAYTIRIFSRLGLAPKKSSYHIYQSIFESHLPSDPKLFGEYHALIDHHAGRICKKQPLCKSCCLLSICPTGRANREINHPPPGIKVPSPNM